MSQIPPALFTMIIIGSFIVAAVIIRIADGIKALKRKRKREKSYKVYERSRRKRIRDLRRKQFRQDVEDMDTTYKAAINYKADRALEWLRCRNESCA